MSTSEATSSDGRSLATAVGVDTGAVDGSAGTAGSAGITMAALRSSLHAEQATTTSTEAFPVTVTIVTHATRQREEEMLCVECCARVHAAYQQEKRICAVEVLNNGVKQRCKHLMSVAFERYCKAACTNNGGL